MVRIGLGHVVVIAAEVIERGVVDPPAQLGPVGRKIGQEHRRLGVLRIEFEHALEVGHGPP